MKDVMRKFEQLCQRANSILDETFDCRQVEPIYIKILNLIKSNPHYHDQFISALLSVLESGKAPWELIQFCMRELQWPEIKDSVLIQMQAELEGKRDWRSISVLDHILEVYEPEWSDADLYKYYSKDSKKN